MKTKALDERLNLNWYNKRISQNNAIKNFLANKILEHEPKIGHSKHMLMYLNYEDLLELAIACVNKNLSVVLGEGKDYCDKSDSKFVISQFRNNNAARGQWMHSMRVTGVTHKEGGLRVCGYNTLANKFHFFYIPYADYQHVSRVVEIVIESATSYHSEPNFNGTPNLSRAWWIHEVPTFEDMCLAGSKNLPPKKNLEKFEELFSFHA